jgi:hypothetical protein
MARCAGALTWRCGFAAGTLAAAGRGLEGDAALRAALRGGDS